MKKSHVNTLLLCMMAATLAIPMSMPNTVQAKEVITQTIPSKAGQWFQAYGHKYYLTENEQYTTVETSFGHAVTGLCEVDGKLYYFRPDGRLWYVDYGTNIYNYNGIDYFYTIGTGELSPLSSYTGIVKDYQYTFYYVKGVRQTKWQKVDGQTYYFLNNGKNGFGRAATGKVTIDGKEYEFDKTGKLISGTTPDIQPSEEESTAESQAETTKESTGEISETTKESSQETSESNEEKPNDPLPDKGTTVHITVPDYQNKSCNLSATEWNERTTYGWNLGNSLSSMYGSWDKKKKAMVDQEELWGQPKTTLELIQYVKACGFNSVRVPVTFFKNAFLDTDGHYKINEDWLNRTAEVVEMCLENDLTVYIVPMCDSLYSKKTPYAPIVLGQNDSKMEDVYLYCADMWTAIANRFKGFDGRLAFEGYNEVWLNTSGKTVYTQKGHEQMNKINQIFVDSVRKTGGANADRILILPTYGHEYDYGALNDFVLPNDSAQNRLIVSVHEYSQAIDQQLDSVMRQIGDFRDRIQTPVIINEWGFTDTTLLGDYALQKKAYANFSYYANKYGIKSYVWDNGVMSEFGLIKRADFTLSDRSLIQAITHPEAFTSKDSLIFDSVNDPNINIYYRFNPDRSGIKYHPWWGDIMVGDLNHGYEIPKGAKYLEASTLKHTTDLKAIQYESRSCAFYDEKGKYISFQNWINNGTLVTIPANAKYVRVTAQNRFEGCSEEELTRWFESGELRVFLGFYQ